MDWNKNTAVNAFMAATVAASQALASTSLEAGESMELRAGKPNIENGAISVMIFIPDKDQDKAEASKTLTIKMPGPKNAECPQFGRSALIDYQDAKDGWFLVKAQASDEQIKALNKSHCALIIK